MGLIIGIGDTKPKFPYDYYYGIEWDTTIANSACKRIGRPELHVSLPIQGLMRRCLLKDDGTVNYYLHPTNSTNKTDGTPAVIDGTDGQVMVEIPAHWRKFEMDGTVMRCFISEIQIPGFHFVPLCYRSAYEAVIDHTISDSPKLASVVNITPEFRGGNNKSDWDGTYRSLLGMPGTNIGLNNLRKYARNRGNAGLNASGWNCDVYEIQKTCYWLYAIEYANFNCQLAYNAEPTTEGYKQGGLGEGVTTLNYTNINSYNNSNPFIPCGYTNRLGNRSGVVNFTMPAEYETLTVQVPSYRGLENPLGHLWSLTDGCKCRIQSGNAGGLSEFYVCNDPSKFQDSNYNDYELRGELPRVNGYVKEMIIGEFGENMPKVIIGSSTTYFCDSFYNNIPTSGEAQRAVKFGGNAIYNSSSGFGCTDTSNSATVMGSLIGSRLCFIPE